MSSINNMQDTSTPKRRRFGNTKIVRPTQTLENNVIENYSPIRPQILKNEMDIERCSSPDLPCNQVEFLCDSGNNSTSSDIPCSPEVLQTQGNQWASLDVSTSKINEIYDKNTKNPINRVILEEIEDISDDMFHSKLEQSVYNHEEKFKSEIEESFNVINESIVNMNEVMKNRSSLFETKDSFLLDIKESGIEAPQTSTNQNKKITKENNVPSNSFYGLPMITKGLFKSYRNIEKFYDWQEECLNLDAIRERRNLIYALPTSGGKTLVAEVLMLREVLNRKKNALFILPFVAIVQEKIWALSPFAVQLDFLVEEYAAGKGHIPPKKRRKKNSIYVATIEKGLALVRSLVELNRLHEIGLIVVDELHLIGEKGRGGTLEMLLSTVIFTNQDIQIVGMSATIGNLHEIAQFLRAEVFQRQFRPVELAEYVKLGNMLHRIQWGEGVEVVPDRELTYDYSAAAVALDPDLLGGLVSEVVPRGSCLVFCPTKRNCENVAALLCKLQRREMASHRVAERQALCNGLRAEGASAELCRAARCGVAFHHAGLASDERVMLEHAFRSGVISVLCCTSTLAAGVNLPAQRVIVRAPLVGREFISLGAYRQMVGRAGRAGVCDTGESIIICNDREWPQLRAVLQGGLSPARSMLRGCINSLVLSAVALGLATCRPELRRLLRCTLLAVTEDDTSMKTLCDDSLRSLLKTGALEVTQRKQEGNDESLINSSNCYVYNDTLLSVSKLGRAAIKGCMELSAARQLIQDMETASRGLVLMGSLHLLYLVTPHDADVIVRPDYRHYYNLYCNLDEEGVQTAKILGITEVNAVKMVTGKAITVLHTPRHGSICHDVIIVLRLLCPQVE
ncbi:mutagen-sensitive 301 isoform X2 [Anticarsia gemmatalis]|uniref:mutagen-sensitive 301 isoform X2 n=1 Tax=Anticarsia gemmatalis TaxID=129554 RepID=UPI003F76F6EC